MRALLTMIFAALFVCTTAYAGFFFSSDTRSDSVATYHTTVGTTTALAIPAASTYANIYSFKICNDPVNASSTYLAIGIATDVATDGIRIDKGQCFVCENCKQGLLQTLRVKGQGASNGYSVIQYRR